MKQVIIAAIASMLVCGSVFANEGTTTATTMMSAEECKAELAKCAADKACTDALAAKGCKAEEKK